jgi:hypothetical protein
MTILLALPTIVIKKTIVTTKTIVTSNEETVLEYIQALTTFPVVTLVIFLIAFLLFRKEIKILIKGLQSFKAPGGFEGVFSSEVVAATAANAALEVEKEALDTLPAGEDRETKTRDLAQKRASIEERVKAVLPPPFLPLDYTIHEHAVDRKWQFNRYKELYDAIEPIIKDTVKNYITSTDSKVYATDAGLVLRLEDPDMLRQQCIKLHSELQVYSRRDLMRVINEIAMQNAPVIKVSRLPKS